jgi:hypothetical protein
MDFVKIGAILAVAVATTTVWPDERPAESFPANRLQAELQSLIRGLDSERFDARERAAAQLRQLAADPETAISVAEKLRQVLVAPDISLEVRKQLERLQPLFPQVSLPRKDGVSGMELDRLVRQLESDSYGARLAAAKRLEWLLETPELTYEIMLRLKERTASTGFSSGGEQQPLEAIYQRAREAWLLADAERCPLPPVTPARLRAWLEELARPMPVDATPEKRRAQRLARQNIEEAMACGEELPRLKAALAAKLAEPGLSPVSAARLRELEDLTRPAMVAEYWQNRKHLSSQFLLIGVPSWGANQVRPSHFDRIDSRTAHCVSGQNLVPGDYPVGVAIPHPRTEGAFFHLVDLSSPRRRLAYLCHAQRDETLRLSEVSRRTLDQLLQQGQPLSIEQLRLLGQLDPKEVSRFAGAFLVKVADRTLPPDPANGDPSASPDSRPSHHGMICMDLAIEGTREAIPGLLAAIEKGRFLPPTPASPYRFEWVAALSIANRDPWREVDAWLAGQFGRPDALATRSDHPAQLGATAAAILLTRHGQDLSRFGLELVPDETFQDFSFSGYRFAAADSHRAVERWWLDRNPPAKGPPERGKTDKSAVP